MQFLPPSCRFPPLREGNRAEVRFPLPAGFPYRVRGTRKARFPLQAGGTLTSAILTSPHLHPLEQQNAHRVSLSLL
jgi:hypothetical protein